MNLDAMKRAIKTAEAKRETYRDNNLARLHKAVRITKRTIQDDKDLFRLKRRLDSEYTALIEMIGENRRLKAELEGQQTKTFHLVKEIAEDRRQQKKRRAKISKENPRINKDEGFVNWYEVCRQIHKRTTRKRSPMKQDAAVAEVIAIQNRKEKRITIAPESVARKYRKWKANRTD